LLIVGAVAVGAYMLTRPRVTTPTYPPGYNPYASPAYLPGGTATQYAGNTTAQDIQAGASGLSALSDLIGNFF